MSIEFHLLTQPTKWNEIIKFKYIMQAGEYSGTARLLGRGFNKNDHLCALKPIHHLAIVLL